MKIKTVLFDLDGTLLDTQEGVLESAVFAAKMLGKEKLPDNIMKKFVGPPIQVSFMEHYGCDKKEAQQAANYFREYYKTNALLKAVPYEGIFETLKTLRAKGFKLAVATYKREDYALTMLEHFGLKPLFDVIHGGDHTNMLTKADIINMCIRETDSLASECILVGDTKFDAQGAEKAGIPFMAVTYGFGFEPGGKIEYPYVSVADTAAEIADKVQECVAL